MCFHALIKKPAVPQAGGHELGPALAGVVTGKKGALATQFFGLLVHVVHVVHELVDEGDGDLLDLTFGVGHFTYEDVAAGVDRRLVSESSMVQVFLDGAIRSANCVCRNWRVWASSAWAWVMHSRTTASVTGSPS